MAGTRELRIQIIGDASSAVRALAKTDQAAGSTASTLKSKMGLATQAAMAGAGAAVIGFGVSSVKAFADAETQHAKLEAAFKKFPALADVNISALDKLNASLARKTKFDDDATASGQAVLAQFGLTGQQIAKMTPLLQDYASRTGKDLPSAAQDLGKAILGQGRALKAIGVNFKDTGSKAGNLTSVMGALQEKVGGFATKEGQTAAGKMAILKNQFGEMQEKVGAQLLPVLIKLADFTATRLLPAITKLGNFVGKHKVEFIALGVGITAALVPAFIAWAAAAVPAAAATLAAAAPVIALGAAVAAVAIVIIKNWDTIKAAFGVAVDFVKGLISGLIDTFKKIPGWIGDAMKGVANIITAPYRAAFNAIAKLWNSTVGKLKFKIPGWVPKIGGKGFDVPNIPTVKALAKGTTNWPGGLALVGEQGPELVRLPRGSDVIPNHAMAGAGQTNHITIVTPNPRDAGRELLWALGRVS